MRAISYRLGNDIGDEANGNEESNDPDIDNESMTRSW